MHTLPFCTHRPEIALLISPPKHKTPLLIKTQNTPPNHPFSNHSSRISPSHQPSSLLQGLGEEQWSSSWEPTMKAILSTGKPVLLSAFGEGDAEADMRWLQSRLNGSVSDGRRSSRMSGADQAALWPSILLPPYQPNPWASQLVSDGGSSSKSNLLVSILNAAAVKE